jgi:hypothetical protein
VLEFEPEEPPVPGPDVPEPAGDSVTSLLHAASASKPSANNVVFVMTKPGYAQNRTADKGNRPLGCDRRQTIQVTLGVHYLNINMPGAYEFSLHSRVADLSREWAGDAQTSRPVAHSRKDLPLTPIH